MCPLLTAPDAGSDPSRHSQVWLHLLDACDSKYISTLGTVTSLLLVEKSYSCLSAKNNLLVVIVAMFLLFYRLRSVERLVLCSSVRFSVQSVSGQYFFGRQGQTLEPSELFTTTDISEDIWRESLVIQTDLQLQSGGATG